MKILHTINKRNLIIFNDRNYAICGIEVDEDGMEKPIEPVKYYNDISSAVKMMSKEVADERADNLRQWIEIYRMTNDGTVKALSDFDNKGGE